MGKFRIRLQAIVSTVSANVSLKLPRAVKTPISSCRPTTSVGTWDNVSALPEGFVATQERCQVAPSRDARLTPLRRSQVEHEPTRSIPLQEQFVDSVHVGLDGDLCTTYVYDAGSDTLLDDMVFASHESLSGAPLICPQNLTTFKSEVDVRDLQEGILNECEDETVQDSSGSSLRAATSVANTTSHQSWDWKLTPADEMSSWVEPYGPRHPFGPPSTSSLSLPEIFGFETYDESQVHLEPALSSTYSEEILSDFGADFPKHYLTVEETLDDMLSACYESLPLDAFPLQAPEFDQEFLTSLNLPAISPLRPPSINGRAKPNGTLKTSIDGISLQESGSLPLTNHEAHEGDQLYPPPYPLPHLPSLPPSSASSIPFSKNYRLPHKAASPLSGQTTEAADLIRRAASLLYWENQIALVKNALNGSPQTFDIHLFERLKKLEHLMYAWPERNCSFTDGVDKFKDALSDGTILCRFVMCLSPSNANIASYEMEDNFREFIEVYESLDLPDHVTLQPHIFDDTTLEELVAYARAIISMYGEFRTTPLFHKPDRPAAQVDKPMVARIDNLSHAANDGSYALVPAALASGLNQEEQCLDWDKPKSILDVHCPPPMKNSDHLTSPSISGLPEDDMLLYQQLLSTIRDEGRFGDVFLGGRTEIQNFLNLLQHMLSFPQIVKNAWRELLAALIRISTATSLYPRVFRLASDPQVNKEPVTCGSYGDILRGYVKEQGVCVKVVRLYREVSKSNRFLKSFMREIIIWGQLQHSNILPFYGVYHLNDAEERICLVSPWMENGTLVDYLKACPDANRLLLVHDIASALEYLHNKMIVHGDLKGINILVTLCGRACLTDFGLASINDTEIIRFSMLESTGHEGATTRYEAPELFDDCDGKIHRTTATDIYAFGGICYEIFTGKIPFYEFASPYVIIVKIINGEIPTRPTGENSSEVAVTVPDEIWSFITQCWSYSPQDRPSATEILSMMLLRDLEDGRPEEQEIWSSSRYRSVFGHNGDGLSFVA